MLQGLLLRLLLFRSGRGTSWFVRLLPKELCPEECGALGARYIRWRHEASQLRKARLLEDVREVVLQLHRQESAPALRARVLAAVERVENGRLCLSR
jgi:hypothetical protein